MSTTFAEETATSASPAARPRFEGTADMLFTATTPNRQGDRIVLHLDPEEARKEAGDGQTIFGVAVVLDASRRRLTIGPEVGMCSEPEWTTSAYLEHFGRVMARGPIPGDLFRITSTRIACCG